MDHPSFASWLAGALDAWLAADPTRRQGAFASAVGVDPSTLTRLRRGQQHPSAAQLSAIVRALGCDVATARVAYTLGGIDVAPLLSETPSEAA